MDRRKLILGSLTGFFTLFFSKKTETKKEEKYKCLCNYGDTYTFNDGIVLNKWDFYPKG